MATMLPQLRPSARVAPKAPIHCRWDCLATVTIQADIRRVLHALTIPEYIEAWMEIPGVDRVACTNDDGNPDNFQLELYDAGKVRARLHGRRCFLAPHHLMLTWSQIGRSGSDESLVDIRIRRMRQRCLVVVRHTQLATPTKTVWNSAVWQHSLENLARLLEG